MENGMNRNLTILADGEQVTGYHGLSTGKEKALHCPQNFFVFDYKNVRVFNVVKQEDSTRRGELAVCIQRGFVRLRRKEGTFLLGLRLVEKSF